MGLTEEEEATVIECFELFDTRKCGLLTPYEFKVAVRSLGWDIKKDAAMKLAREISVKDASGHGGIDYESFETLIIKHYQSRHDFEHNIEGFSLLCGDKSMITALDLETINNEIGFSLTQEHITGMIDEFDRDQDGGVELEEFLYLMSEPTFDEKETKSKSKRSKPKPKQHTATKGTAFVDTSASSSLLKAMT